jgi:hypothetical protein
MHNQTTFANSASFTTVLDSFDASPIDDIRLIVVCAWCKQEGKRTILRPLHLLPCASQDLEVESHGICQGHYDQLLAEFIAE